ncbi:MAG TPA: DUF3341 domain-containing protein [Puia sp.]|jgi:hypothetical protein
MAVKKFVVGVFTDEQVLFPAVKKVRSAGYKIHDVYTPMPLHGLDHAMGLRETSLHTAGFIYGITGTTTALSGIGWIFNSDWPLNFGGKSHFDLPAWIPITFELTVLFSAVGMVWTFCWLCQLAPGVRKHHFNLRSTDDQFTMVIECTDKTNEAEVTAFLQSIGATGINTQVAETGWWWGSYAKDRTPFQTKDTALV